MKLKELPKSNIQIKMDNLLIEVEQLKTALFQKDNIIASKSNTIIELQNQLTIQTNLTSKNSTNFTNTEKTLNERITTKDLIIFEKQKTITQLQNQIATRQLEIKQKEVLIENHQKSIVELREQLEVQKSLMLVKESSLRELDNLNRDQNLTIDILTKRVNVLNSSCEQLETTILERDKIVKNLEENNHKKELVIKELDNTLLKKDLIVRELEKKIAISEIKTVPAINSELVFLKEQLADKNLIIELLKSQKNPVFEISNSKTPELLDLDESFTNIQKKPILLLEPIDVTSVLLSGDASLIEEEN